MEIVILIRETDRIRRVLAFVLALLICVSAVIAAAPTATAAAPLPPSNGEPRHTVCHTVSDRAQTSYTGEYSYEALSALSGAADRSDSAAAMRDNALFDALHSLMADTHTFYTTYSGYQEGSLAYYWKATDSAENSDTYVMFYSDLSSGEGVSSTASTSGRKAAPPTPRPSAGRICTTCAPRRKPSTWRNPTTCSATWTGPVPADMTPA